MYAPMFVLHPQLEQDCVAVASLPLSQLLMLDDSRFPWFLLVPRRPDISELIQLNDSDQQQLFHESILLSQAMHEAFRPDKLNVACIGNLVPQLHMHHVARYHDDACWPAPVWGHCQSQGNAAGYHDKDRNDMVKQLGKAWPETEKNALKWLI